MAGAWVKCCTEFHWKQEAVKAAGEIGVSPISVMGGNQTKRVVEARWRAWRNLVQRGFSYASIGRASGYDHTAIRYAYLSDHSPRSMLGRNYQKRRAA